MINPNLFIQRFREGDTISGAQYTGTARGETSPHIYEQRPADGQAAIVGGLIPNEPVKGTVFRRIDGAYVFADGASAISLIVKPPGGPDFVVATASANRLIVEGSLFQIPPDWTVRVETTGGSLGSDGGFVYVSLAGWFSAQQ